MNFNGDFDVVIIGAGIAGISAARCLERVGNICIMLEAKSTYGGRVRDLVISDKDNTKSVEIHLGANWIHVLDITLNPLAALAKQLSLTLHQTSSDDDPGDDVLLLDSCDDNMYSIVDKIVYNNLLKRCNWMKAYINKWFDSLKLTGHADIQLTVDCNVKKLLDEAKEASVEQFGEISAQETRCINWIYDRIHIDLAGPSLSQIDATNIDDLGCDDEYAEALVLSGYFQMIKYLYEEYPLNALFDHVVTSIRTLSFNGNTNSQTSSDECSDSVHYKSGSRVCIECQNGVKIYAKKCLVTVPIGVLWDQKISFQPRTPLCIENALSTYKPGIMNLVWCWFPYKFWPSNQINFYGVTRSNETPVTFSTFLVVPRKDSEAMLMCQVVGEFALKVENMSEAELTALVMATLRSMFVSDESSLQNNQPKVDNNNCDNSFNNNNSIKVCKSIPDPLRVVQSKWASDPFARGSWSYVYNSDSNNNNNTQHQQAEISPVESTLYSDHELIFYAGEATHEDYIGTVHGAYLSAQETANKIIELLRKET